MSTGNKSIGSIHSANSGIINRAGHDAVGAAQDALRNRDDAGSQAVSHTVGAAIAAQTVFKASQSVTPVIINAVSSAPGRAVSVGKGAIDIATTAGRAAVTVGNTAGFIQRGFVPLNKQALDMLKTQAVMTGLNRTVLSKKLINGVDVVKDAKANVINAARSVNQGVRDSYTIIRGVATGNMYSTVSIEALLRFQNAALRIKTGAAASIDAAGRGLVKGGKWTVVRGVPKVTKFTGGVARGLGNKLSQSDNDALQGMGGAINLSRYGAKTAVLTSKATYKSALALKRGTVKAAGGFRQSWFMAKMLREKGWGAVRGRAARAFANAGRSAVSAAMNALGALIRQLGAKVVIPLLLVIGFVLAGTSVITSPVSAISALFGGTFSTTDGNNETDHDIREYLEDAASGVPVMRDNYINSLAVELQGYLKANGGDYDNVHFYTDSKDNEVDSSFSAISNVFYSQSDLINIMQPIFNAVLVSDYDLMPTDAEAHNLVNDIFDSLFHESYEPESHQVLDHYDDDDQPVYADIKTMNVTLSMDGVYELLQKYFTDPIDQLTNLASRTEEQEIRLQNLLTGYDLCLEYINEINTAYGGSTDLSGVIFVNGTRPGSQGLVDLAVSQVGQIGGKPYWSWYGFAGHVEWCATFVSWNEDQLGYISTGRAPKFSSCAAGISWFQSHGQWAAPGYTDLAPGDIIFFDWGGDGKADHVGLVVGTDGTYVYTVEGNSGDMVRTKGYLLNSSVIFGYGLPNY